MSEYLDEWTSKAGKDNFGANPPNAVLSVYEPGQADSTLAVVEITHPKVDGADLVYNYKVIKGKLPSSGGQTALFIDWIGAGGGVGAASMASGWADAVRRRDPLNPGRAGNTYDPVGGAQYFVPGHVPRSKIKFTVSSRIDPT